MATTVPCSSCGESLDLGPHTRTNATHLSYNAERPPGYTETDFMLKEVDRLDRLISPLDEAKARYLRKVNNTRALTRKLPTEVLSMIFQHARPPIDFSTRQIESSWPKENDTREYYFTDDFQLTLSAVSYHWRQVARSTPQLWTSLSIEAMDQCSENGASLLELYFQNAQYLPVTVQLDCRAQLVSLIYSDPEERSKVLSDLEPLKLSLFISNAHKVDELILTGIPAEWLPFIGKRLSRCHRVTAYWPKGAISKWLGCALSLAEMPSLRRVRMETFVPFTLPQGLTELELTCMPTRVFVEALIVCPALVRFKAYNNPFGLGHVDRSIPTLTQTIVHEHLQELEWCDNSTGSEWARAFLSYFRFSCLRELAWIGDSETLNVGRGKSNEPELENLRVFFSELPSSLKALELSAEDVLVYSLLYLKSMLGGLPHLEELRPERLSSLSTGEVLGMIGHPLAAVASGDWPNPPIVDASITEGPRMSADLKILVVERTNLYLLTDKFVEMLATLHASRNSDSRFILELSNRVRWSKIVVERLRGFLKHDFDILIKEGSETFALADFDPRND